MAVFLVGVSGHNLGIFRRLIQCQSCYLASFPSSHTHESQIGLMTAMYVKIYLK